jgi:hypothetical protein
LKAVVGAHLSQQNNTPELARTALCRVLAVEQVMIACQEEGFGWIELEN